MAKTKRYNGEEESLTGADRDYGGSSGSGEYAPAPEKKQTFKEAFAAAKKGDTFTWEGKKYVKEFAGEKKAAAPAAPKVEAPKVEAPKAASDKSEPSAARVGRASQATVNTSRPKATEEGIAAANERRAKMREEMSDTPIARMFKAIRARGEATQNYAKGGKVGSASKRADGIAQKGKTRCKTY